MYEWCQKWGLKTCRTAVIEIDIGTTTCTNGKYTFETMQSSSKIYIQNTYVRMVYHWGIVDTDFRRLRVRVSICVKKTSPKSYGIVGTIGVYIYLVYIDDVGQAFHKLWHQEKNQV